MQYEVEVKYPVADRALLRETLLRLGAAIEPTVEQADTYFRHPARDFGQTDEALRLRRCGEVNLLTYKGPKIDCETKTRREIELPIGSGPAVYEQFAELLQALGFSAVRTVRKRRQPGSLMWQDRKIHLALDEVEGLGSFVELEATADEHSLAAARGAVLSLAAELGLAECERRSYLELLMLQRSA